MKTSSSISEVGIHNSDLTKSVERLVKAGSYQDLSTIWVTPTPTGKLDSKVVSSWIALQRPMNQQFVGPLFLTDMEVGDAYNKAVEMILDNPQLAKFKYLLTVEHDNIPPSDGLLKLYEGMKKYDGVGGLYWTKGECGQPMIYGDPEVMPRNFIPQSPKIDSLQHCNGLGMGFNLFKIAMFKKMPKPWFRTVQEQGKAFSQDLWFYNNAAGFGYKFACDTRVKVGHMDLDSGKVW